MNKKIRNLLFVTSLIIIIQILLYTNNSQKTSFRYFIWNIQEVSIGRLISISFFSGLLLSIILNNTNYSKSNHRNKFSYEREEEEIHEPKDDDEVNNSDFEMPPQRDVRDVQPTISVNYRVIKNNEENKKKYDQKLSNNSEYQDDWINDDKDW